MDNDGVAEPRNLDIRPRTQAELYAAIRAADQRRLRGGDRRSAEAKENQLCPGTQLKSTAAETAARFGVSSTTVARVRAIADRAEAGDRTAEDAVLAGKSIKAAAALARAGRRKRRLRRQQGRRPARQLVLKAPFSYPGGKGGAAAIVWPLLGEDVRIYIEPFAGSLAVLLARRVPRIETCNDPTMLFSNARRVPDHDLGAVADGFLEVANDLDPYIVNAWRSIQQSPAETAAWCGDIGVDESLLHAVHDFLFLGEEAAGFRRRMERDPAFYDARRAGYWLYFACTTVGPAGYLVPEVPRPFGKRGQLSSGNTHHGTGIHRRLDTGLILPAGRSPWVGACRRRRQALVAWFLRLRDRLRKVQLCCGDWRRVCSSKSVTSLLGTVGLFIDPPYSGESGRTPGLYGVDSLTVAHDVRRYGLEHGDDPRFRIVLAGLAGEGHEELERHGWRCLAWRRHPGLGGRSEAGKERANRERLWASPYCHHDAVDPSLFFGPDG
jgi:DNA adenine methylase